MPERIAAIFEMVRDQRKDQAKVSEHLAGLRVDIARLQRSHENSDQALAEFRAQQAIIFDRLRLAENLASQLPKIEADQSRITAKHEAIEHRVRKLEHTSARDGVVTSAVAGSAREAWKIVLAMLVGAVLAMTADRVRGEVVGPDQGTSIETVGSAR